MDNLCIRISEQIQERTYNVLKDLCGIWQHSYREETIRNNCEKLIDHVADLYGDIIEEAESVKDVYVQQLEKLMKDVTETCKLLSEPLPEECTQDLVLFEAIEILKQKLYDYNEIYNERKSVINDLLSKEINLCKDLGFKQKGLSTSPTLPSSNDIEVFQKYLFDLEQEKILRQTELEKMRKDLTRIFDELEIKPSLDFEAVLLSESDMKVTDAVMMRVRNAHADYVDKLERSKNIVLELRERLSALWERLEEDLNVRNEFLLKYPGHGSKTVSALREEIKKCEEKKKNNIKVFIEKIRKEINTLWDKCMISPEERSSFLAYQSDFYTEDLLTLHEMMVEQLEQFYYHNQKIFELLSKRQTLWEKLNALESKSNDANRYNNRGGKLLQEEKERKKIASQLPKVEEELLLLAKEYEMKTGKVFTAYGEDIEILIKNKHIERKIDKECQLSARKQSKAVTPTASSTRTRLFANTKSSLNVLSTPSSSKQRRRSPVLTPRILKTPNKNTNTPRATKVNTNVMSLKKGQSSFKRRSGNQKSAVKMKKTLSNVAPEELLNTSKAYAQFKTHLSKNSHLRSSIAHNNLPLPTGNLLKTPPRIIISENTPPQSKNTRMTRQNTFTTSGQNKTPRLTRSSSNVSPGSYNNKLSTKNLPIII